MDLRGSRVKQDLWEKRELRASPERRANSAFLACQDIQEDKVLRGHSASPVRLGPWERKDGGVPQVSQGLGAKEVLMEPAGREERGD